MKFDDLAGVARNLADSLGSGASYLFNFWDQHVFRDVANDPNGRIEIDFLAGRVTAGEASEPLHRVAAYAPTALAILCRKHSIEPTAFRKLLACYTFAAGEPQFTVTLEDQQGRFRSDTYRGSPGKRVSRTR
jgi:hypothetical protein